MKSLKTARRLVGLSVLLASLSLMAAACQEKKGPLEKAGEAIDEGVNDAKRKIEDAAD